ALTSFGLGSMYGSGVGGWYGSSYPGYGGAMPMAYSYFPTWGLSTYSSWGLGTVGSSALYRGYCNPYYATAGAAKPAQTTVVYDYSQPINVTAAPPDASVTESSEQVFSAARDSFMAGDYQRALDLSDQVLKQTPNAAVVHEFRALCLFALKRYDEAAAVAYAVLSAGPGWNWSTLVGLYPDVDTYTNQIRALEAFAKSNPNSSSARFLLGYHYMIEGHDDQAATQFEKVTQLLPQDQLPASCVKVLRKAPPPEQLAQASTPAQSPVPAGPPAPAQTPTQATPTAPTPDQTATAQAPAPPPPPPASLMGTWKAQPSPDVTIG